MRGSVVKKMRRVARINSNMAVGYDRIVNGFVLSPTCAKYKAARLKHRYKKLHPNNRAVMALMLQKRYDEQMAAL